MRAARGSGVRYLSKVVAMNKNHDHPDKTDELDSLENLPFIDTWSEEFETEAGLVHVDCFDHEQAERIYRQRQARKSNQTRP